VGSLACGATLGSLGRSVRATTWGHWRARSLVAMPRQSLSDLVDIITLDAYGTDEQLSGFLTAFDERVRVPCAAKVLDVDIEVLGFDIEGDERRGLVARCHRVGGQRGVVSLTDVRFEPGTVAAWVHAAFRNWLGLKAFPARRPVGWSLPEP
jgi:hypothetical protein